MAKMPYVLGYRQIPSPSYGQILFNWTFQTHCICASFVKHHVINTKQNTKQPYEVMTNEVITYRVLVRQFIIISTNYLPQPNTRNGVLKCVTPNHSCHQNGIQNGTQKKLFFGWSFIVRKGPVCLLSWPMLWQNYTQICDNNIINN